MFLILLTGAVPHGATFNNYEFHLFTLSERLNCHEVGLPSIVALSKNLKCVFRIARVQNFDLIVIRISKPSVPYFAGLSIYKDLLLREDIKPIVGCFGVVPRISHARQ